MSSRTIYRDIADLQAHGVPIDGERGIGYLLRDDYFIPALALSALEMEALRWGVGLAAAHADDALARAAQDVLAKLNISTGPLPLFAASKLTNAQRQILQCLREAVASSSKLEIAYQDLAGNHSKRVVRPLSLEHWGGLWTLTSWCELRHDFRVFRVDKMAHCKKLDHFCSSPGQRIQDYLRIAKQAKMSEAEAEAHRQE